MISARVRDDRAKERREAREQPRTMELLRNGAKPGRNDACRCGSGKRLKYCCLYPLTIRRGLQPSIDPVDAVMASLLRPSAKE